MDTTISITITLNGSGEPKVSVESSTVHPAAALEATMSERLYQRTADTVLRVMHKLNLERGAVTAAELRRYVPSSQLGLVHRALDELESDGVIVRDNSGKYLLAE